MTDDELISLYVDGALDAGDRAAFDERLSADSALRRQVAATRLLTSEARQLPPMAAPRNFILPRDAGAKRVSRPARPALIPAWIFRFGSIAAAALFAVLVGADALAPRAMNAPIFDQATVSNATRQVIAAAAVTSLAQGAEGAQVPAVPATKVLVIPSVAALPDASPQVMVESAPAAPASSPDVSSARNLPSANTTQAESPATSLEAQAMESNVQPSAETVTSASAAEPIATSAPSAKQEPVTASSPAATAAPPVNAPLETPPVVSAAPVFTPTRVAAGLALVLALVLGALGWLRRG